jgi:transposase InsO family protein
MQLNAYLFFSLSEVTAKCEEWRLDCNMDRLHKSLGYVSPWNYAELQRNTLALSTSAGENALFFSKLSLKMALK